MFILYFIYPFLNFCAGDAESAKEIAIVESSSQPVGLSAESAAQSHDISESSDCAEFSQCLEQVVFLSALQFYIN